MALPEFCISMSALVKSILRLLIVLDDALQISADLSKAKKVLALIHDIVLNVIIIIIINVIIIIIILILILILIIIIIIIIKIIIIIIITIIIIRN